VRDGGTIDRTCAILASLIRGATHDRHSIAKTFECNVAAADRYIRALESVPGIEIKKLGRLRIVQWYFTAAMKAAGVR